MLIKQKATTKELEEVKRIQEEIDMPKPRNYIMMLWKPILEAAKQKYGDLITGFKEVPPYDGTGDMTFEIQMRNDEKLMEVDQFFSSQTYHLLVNQGVVINVYVQKKI
ncbi:hypothetical protein FJZ31_22845 [Candidatus Poribacteria bacterium]|nr:hypothetical protein [Candidatus Poribacteria bacterium]